MTRRGRNSPPAISPMAISLGFGLLFATILILLSLPCFYLIADDDDTLGPNNAFGLPSGQYEIGLAIQDRTFNEDGSLFYNAQLEDAFKGEYVVVNGKVNPFLNVDQGKYKKSSIGLVSDTR